MGTQCICRLLRSTVLGQDGRSPGKDDDESQE